jgi:hypothetical protein
MMKKVVSLLAVAASVMALNTENANAYTFDYAFALIGTGPGTMALLGICMLGLVIYCKRRMNYIEA